MKKFIIERKGKEEGPVDQETLEHWAQIKYIRFNTPVRPAMLNNWKNASNFPFLEQYFKNHDDEYEAKQTTSFKRKYLYNHPKLIQRIGAGVFDCILLGVFAFILYIPIFMFSEGKIDVSKKVFYNEKYFDQLDGADMSKYEKNEEEKEAEQTEAKRLKGSLNPFFYFMFFIFCIGLFFYYGISLGFYAQTFGMWYWGIFISSRDGKKEVYMRRAYIFAIAAMFLGFLTPIFSIINPDRRSLHEILTGTRVIRISAKPKA